MPGSDEGDRRDHAVRDQAPFMYGRTKGSAEMGAPRSLNNVAAATAAVAPMKSRPNNRRSSSTALAAG